jgi:DNA polymerase I-like protein with 3'-5' exonuclease and polymerase domains
MTQQLLLHLGTYEEDSFAKRLAGLTAGQQVAWKQRLSTPGTIAEIELQCKSAGVTGVVCTNQLVLEKLLHQQPDFLPPNNKRGVTLDDYQGSLLRSKSGLPFVFINPLKNLVTVPYATNAAQRFISKLTQPQRWWKQTAFTWELANVNNIETVFNRWLANAAIISCDIETIVDDPQRRISCVGFCAYFPASHTTECIVIPFTDLYWIEWVRKFCQLPQPKVFQNGLYDNLYLLRWGIPVTNWLFDTQHLFHSWYSEFPKRLDFITAYCVRDTRYWKDDGKTGTLEDYYRYNAKDCWATLNSWLSMVEEVPEYAFNNYVTEFPLVFPCLTCELDGLAVDMERLAVVKTQKENEVEQLTVDFQTMVAAPGFNVNSSQQVKKLFSVLGVGHLPTTAKADMLKAQASTAFNGRILGEVTKIREARKLVSTYFKPEKFWNSRLYYKINPAGTDTGRLASSESSFWCGLQIQNIPRGDAVKQFIISDPGWLLCEIDKAQSEARCVGYLSGEEKLIQLVESSHDYHSWNAAAFFGRTYESIYDEAKGKTIDKVIRDLAKRTNHGANYNMGAWMMLNTMGPKNVSIAKIALKLRLSLEGVCQYLLDRYSATYPKVKGLWYETMVAEVEKTGRLTSALGWVRIFFAKPRSSKPALNSMVAHPPQNLSVSIINIEFYNIWRSQIHGNYYKHPELHLGGFTERGRIAGQRILREVDLRGKVRIKAQIHDSNMFQYRVGMDEIPELVRNEFMDTRIPVRGADGITRSMYIPSDISAGKVRWSDLK